jgi:GTP pyrophosphokinase
MADRTIKLAWGSPDREEVRIATLKVDVFDRSGLLLEIAGLLQHESVNIASISTRSIGSGGKVRVLMDLEIANPRQLVRILHRAHALVNVYAISYVKEPTTQNLA